LVDKRDYPPFFGHTGDVPSRFLNDQPPVAAADARRDAGAADCASASDADTAAATPNWFSDFLIDRAHPQTVRAHDEGVPARLHRGG
jgi:hypothetical protein